MLYLRVKRLVDVNAHGELTTMKSWQWNCDWDAIVIFFTWVNIESSHMYACACTGIHICQFLILLSIFTGSQFKARDGVFVGYVSMAHPRNRQKSFIWCYQIYIRILLSEVKIVIVLLRTNTDKTLGARLNMNMTSYQERDYHHQDKTVSDRNIFMVRIPIPGKTVIKLKQIPRILASKAKDKDDG